MLSATRVRAAPPVPKPAIARLREAERAAQVDAAAFGCSSSSSDDDDDIIAQMAEYLQLDKLSGTEMGGGAKG